MAAARTGPPRTAAGLLLILLVVAAWAYLYRLGTPALLDDPNDAQYAEVAREMVESGDWISPQLDSVVFLNKPPLAYWLIAAAFALFGVNEFAARLPGAVTALALLLLTWRLGRALWDEWAGLTAAGVLLATAGILLEARLVRPDLLLTTGIAGAVLAGTRLARAPDDRAALIGWQVALAVALLAKGIVGLLLPAAALAAAMLTSRDYRLLRTLAHPRAWWLFVALTAPWHVVVALRHPGFAWDYLVNQHLLFFLDRKLPRDSEGIALWQFWAAFGGRLFPWTLCLPLAVIRAWPRGGDARERWAGGLLLGLSGVVALLFSATASRLEHYSLPALPACALLIGALFHRAQHHRKAVLVAHVVPLVCVALIAPFALPSLVAGQDWLAPAAGLPELGRAAGWILAAGALATLVLTLRPRWAPVPLIAAMCALVPVIQQGLVLMAPLNSSAPLAHVITAVASEADTVVYEAPVEYQSGAGLFFYTKRKWWLLRPAGFVAPPYLVPHEDELFLPRAELLRRWPRERIFVVSDPLVAGRTSMKGVVPDPFWIVARSGNRWIVSSQRP